MPTWKVKLAESEEPPPGTNTLTWVPSKPRELPGFGVEASMVDDALKNARKWLVDRGEKVRSLSVCVPITDCTLTAVVVARKRDV